MYRSNCGRCVGKGDNQIFVFCSQESAIHGGQLNSIHGISHFRPREFSLFLMFSRLQVYSLVFLSMAESAPLHTAYDFPMIC